MLQFFKLSIGWTWDEYNKAALSLPSPRAFFRPRFLFALRSLVSPQPPRVFSSSFSLRPFPHYLGAWNRLRHDVIARTPMVLTYVIYSQHTTVYRSCMPITTSYTFRFIVIHSFSFACNLFISKFVTLS